MLGAPIFRHAVFTDSGPLVLLLVARCIELNIAFCMSRFCFKVPPFYSDVDVRTHVVVHLKQKKNWPGSRVPEAMHIWF